jgi:hypothetical protein
MHKAIPPLPQYAFMAWCLINHRDFTPHIFRNLIISDSIDSLLLWNLKVHYCVPPLIAVLTHLHSVYRLSSSFQVNVSEENWRF